MTSRLFGTDGVRGVANDFLTPELAFQLGRAGAYVLSKQSNNNCPTFIIGKDTRLSGDMLEGALLAGITSVGVDVLKVGVIPTPGVAYLAGELEACGGVMISASHNSMEDNGIKFFNSKGFKLSDQVEDEIEQYLQEGTEKLPRPIGKYLGSVKDGAEEGRQRYLEHLKKSVTKDFAGIKAVIDCANGAACGVAQPLLEKLGCDVIAINDLPDGTNINVECGSTHPEKLASVVLDEKADIGFAFDGDADRLIAVDDQGSIIDGDIILTLCSTFMKEKGKLKGNTVVATVMSNLGLDEAAGKAGINIVKTKVGDRYVLEKMQESGYTLGGEQSGHIIFMEHGTTGDGILTAIQLLDVVINYEKKFSELTSVFNRYPQMLKNCRVRTKDNWEQNENINQALKEAESKLKDQGRVLVRPSGTEALIRVMVEGRDKELLHTISEELVSVINQELG